MNKIVSKKVVKVVLFDLMGEYTVLLADQLLKLNTGRILIKGRNTLPEGLFKYINDISGKPDLAEAVEQLKRYTLLPKALLKERTTINYALQQLIEKSIIRVYKDADSLTIYDLFFTDKVDWSKKRQTAKFNQRKEFSKALLRKAGFAQFNQNFTVDIARKIRKTIEKELEQPSDESIKKLAKEFKDDFDNHIVKLHQIERAMGEELSSGVTLDEIIDDLNNTQTSSLWIVQAHNPNELREFSKRLGDALYEKRRQNGTIDPLVSFIFDEADEFIPGKPQGKSYEASKEIVETLARRGRKFGIGIGIATQRTRYLDTSIMAQPHTYLVSKLPRGTDREVVAEAFGVSQDMFRQTFKFKPGNWLIMSHDATGLKAIPVPIQTKDANKRIVKNLKWLQESEEF